MEPTQTDPVNVWAVVSAYQFWVTGVVIQGVLQLLAKVTDILAPGLMERKGMKAFVATQPFMYGVLAALIPGWFIGTTFAERGMMGLCAGILSHLLYAMVIKKFETPPTPPAPPAV